MSAPPLQTRGRELALLYTLADEGRLSAVVDAAGKPDVYHALVAMGPEVAGPLYAGAAARDYAGVAPWLVQVDAARADWIGAVLAPDPAWGLFVIADADAAAVRRQLRRLLTVRLPEGDLVHFRFYDPRLFPAFLGACTPSELAFVFGPVQGYAVADPVAQRFTVYDRRERPVHLPRLRLASAPMAAPAVRTASPPAADALTGVR